MGVLCVALSWGRHLSASVQQALTRHLLHQPCRAHPPLPPRVTRSVRVGSGVNHIGRLNHRGACGDGEAGAGCGSRGRLESQRGAGRVADLVCTLWAPRGRLRWVSTMAPCSSKAGGCRSHEERLLPLAQIFTLQCVSPTDLCTKTF